MNNRITCPNCQTEIEITEVISGQLRASIRRRGERVGSGPPEAQAAAGRDCPEQKGFNRRLRRSKTRPKRSSTSSGNNLNREFASRCASRSRTRAEQLAEIRGQLKAAQEKELAVRKREREMKQLRSQLDQQRVDLEDGLRKKLEAERASLVSQATEKAKEELAVELKDREMALVELQAKVQQANQKELEFLKRRRESSKSESTRSSWK